MGQMMQAETNQDLDDRKHKEREFHDRREHLRQHDPVAYQELTRSKKFYSVTRKSTAFWTEWLRSRAPGRQMLDYCCGTGNVSLRAASFGAKVTGIDISSNSIERCQDLAREGGLQEDTRFLVMDAENLAFEPATFDLVTCMGVLHHLDIRNAYREIAKVLKPDGEVICVEALGHNPIINLYRRMTPRARTAWETEHILKTPEIELARSYFGAVNVHHFHLATLAAVPFRRAAVFDRVLRALEAVDSMLLALPWIQRHAWQVVFTLAQPRKRS